MRIPDYRLIGKLNPPSVSGLTRVDCILLFIVWTGFLVFWKYLLVKHKLQLTLKHFNLLLDNNKTKSFAISL